MKVKIDLPHSADQERGMKLPIIMYCLCRRAIVMLGEESFSY